MRFLTDLIKILIKGHKLPDMTYYVIHMPIAIWKLFLYGYFSRLTTPRYHLFALKGFHVKILVLKQL